MKLLERVIGVLTPDDCLLCGQEGLLLCDRCQAVELIRAMPECYRCHRPSVGFSTCSRCRARSPLSAVYVACTYEGVIRQLIENYKFKSRRSAVKVLSSLVTDGLSFSDIVVTYCPTVPAHYRQRGFDHAHLLARQVAGRLSLPCFGLLRRTNWARQVGASRSQRLHQMTNAFTARRQYLIKGQTILLIDDVLTTGSTLEAAARMLKKAGAKQVIGLVVARAV